jgi:hypothetical protein
MHRVLIESLIEIELRDLVALVSASILALNAELPPEADLADNHSRIYF